jgi:ribosome biogenesis GTPase A
MKTMLSQIDHIIECRDYRIPLTSRNPMFEDSLAGRARVVVYTKKDLGTSGTAAHVKVRTTTAITTTTTKTPRLFEPPTDLSHTWLIRNL